jgi:AraC-like DNA-binding protein
LCAARSLRTSHSLLIRLAAVLGFAEPSAFHCAFRKWTGAPPAAYRRKNRDGEARAESPTFTEDSGMRETLRKGQIVL